ncbi:GLPGLI family protein [Flagellimonas sp. HMM57]|uniref:GLPGLI family protein n=1 Tax=unclassified Flagellimonas TaxID=2644544 RepID=UPI0013D1AB51|nr:MULTISPECIES: GLPGLI family protein [unclassified Flagellimonas]UII76873.1 GLPGLI family protein [Flagellimonas sp. HMM57]
MKKTIISLILFLSCFVYALAQDFKGIAIYQSKTSVDMDLDNRQIPEDQKQRIRERMKNAMERSFELTFDRTTSIYIQEEKLETPSTNTGRRGGFRVAFGAAGAGELYKNVQGQAYINQTEMFGKIFLIKDSLTGWEWKLGSETKKIGNYTCYKATAVKKTDSVSFRNFRPFGPRPNGDRGTNPRDSVQQDSTKSGTLLSRTNPPKDRTVTAWYTPEIPISQGPGNYWGLPGLILEVNDERTAILCSKIILNPKEKIEIKAPSKGKVVTQEEYNAIMVEKMKEMSEQFRNGNRRGGGDRIRIRG